MLRILGGLYKGRRLARPPLIRPTSDKVRQAAFNILGEAVVGARVLELYAGSGALGLEALSHGAAQVTLVESEAQCVRAIKANITQLGAGASGRATVIAGRATQVLARLGRGGERFDLVLMDPPYDGGMGRKCLIQLEAYAIITPCGWAMLEHAAQDAMPQAVGQLKRCSQHRYGDTVLSLYQAAPA